MLVKESPVLTEAIRNKDHELVAEICIGWTATKNYTIKDAFHEGLAVGRRRPKRLFSAQKGLFTFFFPSEREALKEIRKLPDLLT